MKKNKNEGNDVEEKVSSAESDDNRSDDRVKVTKSVFQVSREEREKQRQEELRKQEELEKEIARREKEKQEAYLKTVSEVSLGSDAFFPFSDNILRAFKSGVKYVAEPGGSIRDDDVIACCDAHDMVMAFTGMRLFHH